MKINLYERWKEVIFCLVFREKELLVVEKDLERCERQTPRMGERAHQVMEEHRIRDTNGSKAGTWKHNKQ